MTVRTHPAVRRVAAWVGRHQVIFWWTHSAWALLSGVAFMWVGVRHFNWLRIAFLYIALIWLSSLFLPLLIASGRVPEGRHALARQVVNYFHRNFYQQLLFFVLPVYAASVTWTSPNVLFLGVVALSAVLSTFDVIYDRHMSPNRPLMAVFFAFNLFVCVNVALPVLWSISNRTAMRMSGALALVGFVTLGFRPRDVMNPRVLRALVLAAGLIAAFVELGPRLVPPAPLTVVSTEFGTGFDREGLSVTNRLSALDPHFGGRLYGVSAIRAPLGLREQVRHRWTAGAVEIARSPFHVLTGGRSAGFRLWTSSIINPSEAAEGVDLWVETEGGQIIGRARLPSARVR